MTIQSADIKLFESQRLTDTDDGGGRRTGNEVTDGQVNNLFPDISRLDRTFGRVNLRKGFTGVDTATTDIYYGSHIIVDDEPDDPNVGVCLFSTGSHTDERADAQNRIESYVIQGPESRLRLIGDQLEGQRSLNMYQREEDELPSVGDVYVLSVEDSALSIDGQQQYVRVTNVSHEIQTFSENTGSGVVDFEVRAINLSISTELTETYPASAPTRDFGTASTVVRSTQVAQAAKYYGIKPVDQAIAQGDTQIKLSDVFHPIVPSTKSENPQVDIPAAASVTHEETSGGNTVTVSDRAHTQKKDVTIANRGLSYTMNLKPLPAPGTAKFEFIALGNWQTLQDRGDGKLEGDGSGTVDYSTGSASLTLAAEPDVGTKIVATWGTKLHYTDRAGTGGQVELPEVTIVPQGNVLPGTATIEWTDAGGTTRAANDDGEGGLTGDVSAGIIVYTGDERVVRLQPSTVPAASTQYALSFDEGTIQTENMDVNNLVNGTSLSQTPIDPGSVTIEYTLEFQVSSRSWKVHSGIASATEDRIVPVQDDGQGNLIRQTDGATVGSITYSDGSISVDPRANYDVEEYAGTFGGYDTPVWKTATRQSEFGQTAVAVRYYVDGVSVTAVTQSVDAPPIRFNITQTTQELVAPGTLRFNFGKDEFIDRRGDLFRAVQADGSGINAGSINYDTGEVKLIDFRGGDPTLTINTMMTKKAKWNATSFSFRTPGAPIKPLSLYLQVSDTEGNLIEATADANGVLSSEWMDGTVDTETGIVDVRFGKMVNDADLTSEDKNEEWYDADNVENGEIFAPLQVLPETATFNTVILTSLPLDADLLGLNPVRLPGDGRVPIFQRAGVVVLHHTDSEAMPSPLSAGQTVSLSRADLALVRLVDQNDAEVDRSLYSVDLAAGSVTMADPLDLSGYTEPLVAHHRIEEMLLVTDVEIDGRITVSSGPSRDFPAGAKCSSALIYGDLQSRVTDYFEQEAWDGSTWSDTRQGNDTTASYNTTNYPIEVENQGAIRERWALDFTSSTTFDVVGESVGVIAQGDTSTDLAPLNPETGTPYFKMLAAGFGSGWEVGNLIRFNTEAAAAPVWVVRTILPGDPQDPNDSFQVQNRGDAE